MSRHLFVVLLVIVFLIRLLRRNRLFFASKSLGELTHGLEEGDGLAVPSAGASIRLVRLLDNRRGFAKVLLEVANGLLFGEFHPSVLLEVFFLLLGVPDGSQSLDVILLLGLELSLHGKLKSLNGLEIAVLLAFTLLIVVDLGAEGALFDALDELSVSRRPIKSFGILVSLNGVVEINSTVS